MKDVQFLLPKANPPRFIRYNETLTSIAAGNRISNIIKRTQENERKLIGQELHDNVNQILSTVKLFLDMLHPQKARDKNIRDKSTGYVMMAIEEIRKISRELVVSNEPAKGLADSIRAMIDDIHFATRIKIAFHCHPGIECLDQERKTALLRIVQEQLKNIVNYSKAKQVVIDLDISEGNVMMEIKDNGIGFDISKTGKGIGLSNIYERTVFFNGSVDLQSASGKGCVLQVNLPAA